MASDYALLTPIMEVSLLLINSLNIDFLLRSAFLLIFNRLCGDPLTFPYCQGRKNQIFELISFLTSECSIMIDLLSAPGTFAMGCHSKFSDNVSEEVSENLSSFLFLILFLHQSLKA